MAQISVIPGGLVWLRPKSLQPCVIVDVFLPKNLVNLEGLTKILKETLDFDAAQRYLRRNAKKLFNEYRIEDGERELHPGLMDGAPTLTKIGEFQRRLARMDKRIEGYSIFEVDGAFEFLNHKSSVIGRGAEVKHAVPRRSRLIEHFRVRSPNFVKMMFASRGQSTIRGGVHLFPSAPTDERQRVVEVDSGGRTSRHHFEQHERGFTSRRCLTIIEERNLMIRFITKPVNVVQDADPFGYWSNNVPGEVQDVLWDTLVVVGCFFARRLGREGGVEDEIWLTYDIGKLWIWKKGEPMLTTA